MQNSKTDMTYQQHLNLSYLEDIAIKYLHSFGLDSEGRPTIRILDSIPHGTGLVVHFCNRIDSELTKKGMGLTSIYAAVIYNSSDCHLYKYTEYSITAVNYSYNQNLSFPKIYSEYVLVNINTKNRVDSNNFDDPIFKLGGLLRTDIEEIFF